jgi:hypothetical protein
MRPSLVTKHKNRMRISIDGIGPQDIEGGVCRFSPERDDDGFGLTGTSLRAMTRASTPAGPSYAALPPVNAMTRAFTPDNRRHCVVKMADGSPAAPSALVGAHTPQTMLGAAVAVAEPQQQFSFPTLSGLASLRRPADGSTRRLAKLRSPDDDRRQPMVQQLLFGRIRGD